ncbi:MAG TPA: hypothetical protein VGU71_11095 [Candidatus Dormibacteraeota bacterium]|nr:hypothetical protein [Candidatus Dormibacteraeota bacterium]
MKRIAFLATAAAAYLLAAWAVAPGFYDGFTPPQPYNWVSPPPQATGNLPPKSGHLVIKVINGVSDANSAFTDDGQLVIGFLPGAFDVTGKTSVSVDIRPVSNCSTPTGIHFATNVYLITASAPLVIASNLVLRFSDLVPAPSAVYFAPDTVASQAPGADCAWQSIGAAQQSRAFTLDTSTRQLGYFAAGYAANATHAPGSSSQLLPIVVAILIVVVLIAGIPLAVLRRRRAGEVEDSDEEDS